VNYLAPTLDEDAPQRILDLQACLDRFEKPVTELQTVLAAEKNQSSVVLEREKLNMTHTKCNLNLQSGMKDRSDAKLNCKGSVEACNHPPLDLLCPMTKTKREMGPTSAQILVE